MTLALLLRYWHFAALAALLAFGAFEWHEHNAAEVAKGVCQEKARVADSSKKAIETQLARVETTYVRDTIRLTKTLTRTTTLRDTLLVHLTDTLMVKQFIVQTDSTVKVCTEVASTCAEKLRLKDQEIGVLKTQLGSIPPTAVRHWYSDRFTLGPYAGLDSHGKASVGVSAQLALFRFP